MSRLVGNRLAGEQQPVSSDLGEVVARLVDDMSTIKQELISSRWQTVADNFAQIGENFNSLHIRLKAIEDDLERRAKRTD